MIVRNIASVPPTKNASGKIVSKISNSWELNVSYLAKLCYAVIIISYSSVELQQISGLLQHLLGCPKLGNT
jgi:hypothetical protein